MRVYGEYEDGNVGTHQDLEPSLATMASVTTQLSVLLGL